MNSLDIPPFLLDDPLFDFNEHYIYKSILGNGSFGSVIEVVNKENFEIIAIKVIPKGFVSTDGLQKLKGEASLLSTFNHPNIVKLKHILESENKFYLGLEKLEGGSLSDLMINYSAKKKKFSDLEASTIIKGIVNAVQYIHGFDIVHRDLKPDNILFAKKNDLKSVKVIDFGLSAKFDLSSFFLLSQQCGTLIYMAPEIINKSKYSKSVDLWSVGIIMFMLLSGGKHPFYTKDDNSETYIQKLNHNKLKYDEGFSKLAKDLLSKLCCFDITERYSAKEVLEHPWITRQVSDIPLTMAELLQRDEAEENFNSRIPAMIFISYLLTNSKYNIQFKYLEKMKLIGNKIKEYRNNLSLLSENPLENDNDLYIKLTSSPSYQEADKELMIQYPEEEKGSAEVGKNENNKFDLFEKNIVINKNKKSNIEEIVRQKSNYNESIENGNNSRKYSKVGMPNIGCQDIRKSNQIELGSNQKNAQGKSFKESPKKNSQSPPHNVQKERKNSMATYVHNQSKEINHLSMVADSSKKFNPSFGIKDHSSVSPNSKYSVNNKTKPSSPVTKIENATKKTNSPKLFSSICSSKNFSPIKKESKKISPKYNAMKHVKLKLNNS